jgi:hypothetical protein
MATGAAAIGSVVASEAKSDISRSEAWKEWQVVQDNSNELPTFSLIGNFLGDEPVPVVREFISDDASDLSSDYEEDDDFDDDDDDEDEDEERYRRQPDVAKENTECGDHSPEDLSDDEIFASRTVDEGYAMVVVANKDHLDKHVAWNKDSEAYDSELSVNTKRTCNTTASTSRDDASCKTTDSPFFGTDTLREKSKPNEEKLKPSLKLGPPPGLVLSSKRSRHAEDESSMESDSSDDEPFFDEVEPNKGTFELLLDKIIDGMLPHHGLDTPFCNYESDECQEPSDSEPDDSSQERVPKERVSLFKADDDDDSVDVVDDEAVDVRSVDEIEKLREFESPDSFDCDDKIEEERQVKKSFTLTTEKFIGDEPIPDNCPAPFSASNPDNDQGTKGLYANLVTEAVCVQGRGARTSTEGSDPP